MKSFWNICLKTGSIVVAVFLTAFNAIAFASSRHYSMFDQWAIVIDSNVMLYQFALPGFISIIVGLFSFSALTFFWMKRRIGNQRESEGLLTNQFYPIEKIEKLRWAALSDTEKKVHYERFRQLSPKVMPTISVLASPSRQRHLQRIRPINLSYQKLFKIMWPAEFDGIRFPLDLNGFEKLNDFRKHLIKDIGSRNSIVLTDKAVGVMKEIYHYMSCADMPVTHKERLSIDVAIVAAARWSLPQRVEEAFKQFKISNSDLIFTGGRPYYDDNEQGRIAESEIMFYHCMTKTSHPPEAKIKLETNSRNSIEALRNSIPLLLGIRKGKPAPLNIGIVTSTLHMRRFHYMAQEVFKDSQHVVNKIYCLGVQAEIDHGTLISNRAALEGRSLTILQVFLTEYLKLIGGRAIGEF